MYVSVPASRRSPGQELRQRTDLTPPHAHLLFLPLAALPLPTAFAIFTLLNISAAVWSGYVVARELALDFERASWVAIGAVCVASTPAASTLINGQPSFLYLIPVVLAWRAHRQRALGAAGAWLGLLSSVKPFFGVFAVYFLLRREWRPAGTMVGSALGSFLVGLAAFGWEAHVGWLNDLASITWVDHPANTSIFGMAARMGLPGPALVAGITGAMALAALAIRRTESIDRHWLILLTTALLLAPLGWMYYWPWLAVPAAAVARVAPPRTRVARIGFLLGWASAWWPWIPPLSGPMVEATAWLSIHTCGLFLLLASQLPPAGRAV